MQINNLNTNFKALVIFFFSDIFAGNMVNQALLHMSLVLCRWTSRNVKWIATVLLNLPMEDKVDFNRLWCLHKWTDIYKNNKDWNHEQVSLPVLLTTDLPSFCSYAEQYQRRGHPELDIPDTYVKPYSHGRARTVRKVYGACGCPVFTPFHSRLLNNAVRPPCVSRKPRCMRRMTVRMHLAHANRLFPLRN